jgi:hypothetical protein
MRPPECEAAALTATRNAARKGEAGLSKRRRYSGTGGATSISFGLSGTGSPPRLR